MTKYTFAQIPNAIAKYQNRIDYTLQYAVNKLIEAAQRSKGKAGHMPVDTGALRRSLLSELNGAAGALGPDSYAFVAGSMKGGDFATFKWTVDYAFYVNSGAKGRAGAHFVEFAADQWKAFVEAGAKEAIARYP